MRLRSCRVASLRSAEDVVRVLVVLLAEILQRLSQSPAPRTLAIASPSRRLRVVNLSPLRAAVSQCHPRQVRMARRGPKAREEPWTRCGQTLSPSARPRDRASAHPRRRPKAYDPDPPLGDLPCPLRPEDHPAPLNTRVGHCHGWSLQLEISS